MIVEEKLLQSAQAKPKESFKVVIWGGIPASTRKLAYRDEPPREKARILSEMLSASESAAERFLGLAENVETLFPALPAFVASMSGAALLDIERNPTKYPFIYRIEPVRTVKALLNISAPMVGAPKAWELGYTGRGVKIAIVDTGVDAYHSLEGKVSAERNFVEGEDGRDLDGHGTHVAGIAAGDEGRVQGRRAGSRSHLRESA
jgi:subtilisin family serine protease